MPLTTALLSAEIKFENSASRRDLDKYRGVGITWLNIGRLE